MSDRTAFEDVTKRKGTTGEPLSGGALHEETAGEAGFRAGDTPVHRAVRDHYAGVALSSSGCCSSDAADCGCGDTPYAVRLYDGELLQSLPDDVTTMSLGCGDPVTIASLKPGETVIDLGSGAGLDCFLAARQVGGGGLVIGVDMTPAMIEKARASRAKLGLAQVEFRQGYIEAIPVKDGVADVVMSNCVINLSPDKAAVFREAFRVLKPGGRIAVSDIVTEGHFSDADQADLNSWAGCVSGAIDVNLYTGLLAAAGFIDIKVVDQGLIDDRTATGGPRVYKARVTASKPI